MTITCLDILAFLELRVSTSRLRRQTCIFEGKPLLWPITVKQIYGMHPIITSFLMLLLTKKGKY